MIKTQRYFILALLGHLLLFLSYTFVLHFKPELIYKPNLISQASVPTYIYQEPQASLKKIQHHRPIKKFPPLKKVPVSILGYEKPANQEMQMTNSYFPSNPFQSDSVSQQRLNMKSDEKIDAPLLKLLSEATAAKLVYPQISIAFRQTGIAKIRFYLFPDGRVTQVSLLKSSGFDPLDNAALNAIRAISPVRNTNLYLKKPQYITAYIEFR